MTQVLLDIEIVKAIGLSFAFMGVMLSIIVVGMSYLIYRMSKNKEKHYLKMAGLVTGWAVFIALNAQPSASLDYKTFFGVYSMAHLISIFFGATTIIVFLFMLSKFWKIFDKKLLVVVGIVAVLGLRIINPFLGLVYLSLLQRVLIIIPSLVGFFMIIKSYIREGRR